MDRQELDQILDRHKKWLNNEEGGQRADLSGENLRYVDLINANLRCVDLSGADLRGADLRDADLSYADLSYADLRGADLSGAYLSGANLRGADLRGADLRGANLYRANLYCADLECADLEGANLRYADLRDTEVEGITHLHNKFPHRVTITPDEIFVGCERHTIAEWKENYKEIGKDNDYSAHYIRKFGNILKTIDV